MRQEYELKKIRQDKRGSLECCISCCPLPAFPQEVCLVVSFHGAIGSAAISESDYSYLHEMIGAGFAACDPATLILDLAGLAYQPSDRMITVLDKKITTKVIVSALNRESLSKLYREVLFLDPDAELFETLPEAVSACDSAYQDFVRSGRKRTMSADF